MDPVMLSRSITTAIEELSQETDMVRVSRTLHDYLDTLHKFHHYSWSNQLLIWMQKPEATRVAGYRTWTEKFKRQVRFGEKGIAILAPCIYFASQTEGDEDRHERRPSEDDPVAELSALQLRRQVQHLRFKVVYVFDVAQTEGEPLPEAPEWRDTEKDPELEKALHSMACSRGISVQVTEDLGGAQGCSSGGKILLLPGAGTRTFVHELAHELLEHGLPQVRARTTRQQRETEADASAYVVGRHFGLAGSCEPNYLALWQVAGGDILSSLERVRSVAIDIIQTVEAIRQTENLSIPQSF